MQPNPVFSPAVDSPDAGLQAAASKLASLKAARVGVQSGPRPASKLAVEAAVVVQPRALQPAALPVATQQQQGGAAGEISPTAAAAAAAAGSLQQRSPTPEYHPEGLTDNSSEGSSRTVPLAARTAISKRHRRKSQHHGPERFGEWFSGDDDQLERELREYNLMQQRQQDEQAARAAAMEPRLTRAQRRKSLPAPALARSLAADGAGSAAELDREPSGKEKAANTSEEVAAKVAAITSELGDRLDGLINDSPKDKGRKRRNDDDRSLQDKLVEAWDGKSYYERLKSMADDEDGKEQQEPAAAPVEAASIPKPPNGLKIDLLPAISAPPSSMARGGAKTPRRARHAQQLTELTESLKKLQVSGANRTSKAAAALAGKVRSAPGCRTSSPNVAAAEGAGRYPFSAVLGAAAAGSPGHASKGAAVAGARPPQPHSSSSVQKQGPSNNTDATALDPNEQTPAELGATAATIPAAAPPQTAGTTGAAALPGNRKQSTQPKVTPVPKSAAQQPSKRVTRANSKSPEPAAANAAPCKAAALGTPMGPVCTGPGVSTKPAMAAGQDSLRKEMEEAKQQLVVAAESRQLAEQRSAKLKDQLTAEQQLRETAELKITQLESQLKEESRARKAAEHKALELENQLEDLQHRVEATCAAERTLSRVACKAQESASRYAVAENQVAALLKAANTLAGQLGQGREDVEALYELAAGRQGTGEGAAHGNNLDRRSSAGRPARQQGKPQALGTWR
ncbi:hypothetical protein N2152v2_004687 [Parachlorella kessleri]